jgi:hypothetical protein
VPRPLLSSGNISPYSLNRRLDGPQRSSGRVAEKKNHIRPPFLRPSNPWRSHQIDVASIIALHRVIKLYRTNFACCFVWVRSLVADIEGGN